MKPENIVTSTVLRLLKFQCLEIFDIHLEKTALDRTRVGQNACILLLIVTAVTEIYS